MSAPRAALAAAVLGSMLACSSVDLHPITHDARDTGGAGGDDGKSPTECGLPPLAAGDHPQTLRIGEMTRSYVLHVPPSHDAARPSPLVVDFHGLGETAASERAASPYPDVLDREGVVMAFPDGLRGPAGTGWNVGPCCVADVDDVAFARAVVAHVQTLTCIDAARVYAVGVLTGGGMVHYVGCHAADLFAAIAPAAFDLLEENQDDCQPSRPITVIAFRSLQDPRVPYAGGESSLVPGMPLTFLGARESFAKWAEINGCTGGPSPENADGCSSYAGCAGGAGVTLCTFDGQEQQGNPSVAWPVLRGHTL